MEQTNPSKPCYTAKRSGNSNYPAAVMEGTILMKNLSEWNAGMIVKIGCIRGNTHFQSRIASVGLTPGSIVEVIQNEKRRPLLLYIRNTLLAVNREDCSLIDAEVM